MDLNAGSLALKASTITFGRKEGRRHALRPLGTLREKSLRSAYVHYCCYCSIKTVSAPRIIGAHLAEPLGRTLYHVGEKTDVSGQL